ncbi:MAG: PilZ domain-containing protein [Bdellovibrionota bacterium]
MAFLKLVYLEAPMAYQAKRKFPRKLTRDGVRVRTSAGIEYGTFEDLSLGGLRLLMEREMPAGEMIDLEFSFLSPSVESEVRLQVKAMGRVMRSSPRSDLFEIGVAFLSVPKELARHWTTSVDDPIGPF